MHKVLSCLSLISGMFMILSGSAASGQSRPQASAADKQWLNSISACPYPVPDFQREAVMELVRQDHVSLERNLSVSKAPLKIGSKTYANGLGTHAVSHIRIYAPVPITRFTAWVGVDCNMSTKDGAGSVIFTVATPDKELLKTNVLKGGQEATRVDVNTGGAKILDLKVDPTADGVSYDHANWAEATITLEDGQLVRLDLMPLGSAPDFVARYPISFTYAGQSSDKLLGQWKRIVKDKALDADREKSSILWQNPAIGLKLHWDVIRYKDFPAIEWLISFENGGKTDTAILEDIQACNLTIESLAQPPQPFVLHKTGGAPANPTDFAVSTVTIDKDHPQRMGGDIGRSSNTDLPFYKIEAGDISYVMAVGWSGMWQSVLESPSSRQLRIKSGLQKTHFMLHPGERVRMPRILLLRWQGDTLESNAQFRQLINKHYAARQNGKVPLPYLFSNTCFTRGGGWLNETTEQNQIALIKAYAPLKLDGVITDAGWMTDGGWWTGVGSWQPRKDNYPNGMAPVARAAKETGTIYGLWFECESVLQGTWLHKHRPQWLIDANYQTVGNIPAYMLNFALPAVQDYMFGVVNKLMKLPGYRVYRQDYGLINPLPFWQINDKPDRVGLSEIKYYEGLYAYWDRLARAYPDSMREECAAGGRRIDLETIMRMHTAQKSDYWFDHEVDQSTLWALSQYLPNHMFDSALTELDDYSFHSVLPSSIVIGWTADDPKFDIRRATQLAERYRAVRHLLEGAWYPLLPESRDPGAWMVS